MKKIEIVVPCYNEEECIRPLYNAIDSVFEQIENYSYSILYVNDGSRDRTLYELRQLKEEFYDKVNYISFSRNFGKESAIYAGLVNSTGDLVVLMDADLQHPIQVIPKMRKLWEQGYDDVYAKRKKRGK